MSYNELKKLNSNLNIKLVKGDFINDLEKLANTSKPRLYLFLGSTLGNFNNDTAIGFLTSISKKMKKSDFLLLGIDKIKNKEVIEAAYNDKEGITEKFNKNILNVINKEYNLNFNPEKFNHVAEFNEDKNQIEMYLKSNTKQEIQSQNEKIEINSGEKYLLKLVENFQIVLLLKFLKNLNLKL